MADGVGALANLVIIGAMKCATSALHRCLGQHPDIAMSRPKELNFFFADPTVPEADSARVERRCPDPVAWTPGNWQRGMAWYAGHFPSTAMVRGESSPGYTSPSHPGVAARMAATVPHARLVYLVRDPIERTLSQYRHHRREGAESRPLEAALLDPASQYIARGRYHERLVPFLERFPRSQICVVTQEELRTAPHATVRAVLAFVGVDDRFEPGAEMQHHRHVTGPASPRPSGRLRARLESAFVDDTRRLRELTGRSLASWSV